jgi:hypothetical protein
MNKKGMVLLLILVIAGCSSQVSETVFINGTCGPFKGASFGEYANITLPQGANSSKMTLEIYKQVQTLSPNYFKYEFCDQQCEISMEKTTPESVRYFECNAPKWKIRCAYDLEGWVCVNATN